MTQMNDLDAIIQETVLGDVQTQDNAGSDEHIKENSPTLLIDPVTQRFQTASWMRDMSNYRILVGGCGGIGSWVSFLLSRLHPYSITNYDNDTVEASNMGGQLFSNRDIGSKKITQMSSFLGSYSGFYGYRGIDRRYDATSLVSPIMIACFDNMLSRRVFFNKWKAAMDSQLVYQRDSAKFRKQFIFIDGRLSAMDFQIYSFEGDDQYNIDRYYKEHLFDDSEAEEAPCSFKQTTFTACMIGSVISNIFINHVNGLINNIDGLVPFITRYNADTLQLTVES